MTARSEWFHPDVDDVHKELYTCDSSTYWTALHITTRPLLAITTRML